ncbi:4-oxalocrotonate decarboxylase [Aerococcaceae bacterium DSM 111020]|nr:4-oxalocrotonate decarboxylase [Aerococcaceae bacterium DSM 111020]
MTKELAPSLKVEEAYAIQAELLRLREADGHAIIAPKMGLTSKAKWTQMGVDSPVVGYLFDDMIERDQSIEFDRYIHPKIEPEIGIVLKNEIGGPDLTISEVKDNIDYIFSAVEVIDSRYQNFDFTFIDVIIDNTSAKGAILGTKQYDVGSVDLITEQVEILINGEQVAEGKGEAVLGNPIQVIVELAKHLDQSNQMIQPGQPILTGGMTAAVMIEKGDTIQVNYSNLEDLTIEVK